MKSLYLFMLAFWATPLLYAKVTLPTVFSDNMVLQQQTQVKFWGNSTAVGHEVLVKTSWNNKKYKAKVQSNGDWSLNVKTPNYGGPYSITVSDGEELTLNNILIGEVWLCSGQSNMQMPLGGWGKIVNYETEIRTANYDKIRFLQVARRTSPVPLDNAVIASDGWEAVSSSNISEFSATAYFFARELYLRTGIPIGLIHTSWGGTSIESWISPDALSTFPNLQDSVRRVSQNAALHSDKDDLRNHYTVLYNAMIHPFINFRIQGAIWYQGENNAGHPEAYKQLLPAMIKNWRTKWSIGDFPFYYVQLANFFPKKSEPSESKWAELRDAQKDALHLPRTGMAVIADIGESDDIHPKNKQDVGRRLALLALKDTYHYNIISTGPVLQSWHVNKGAVILQFRNSGVGLALHQGNLFTNGFTIAGKDNVYHHADVDISGNIVVVSSDKVKKPTKVRYGWADNPDLTLYNSFQLPASPFQVSK